MKALLAALALAAWVSSPSAVLAGSGREHWGSHDHGPQFDGHGRQIGSDPGPLFDKDGGQIMPGPEGTAFGPEVGRDEGPRQDEFEAAFPPASPELDDPSKPALKRSAPPGEAASRVGSDRAATERIEQADGIAEHPERLPKLFGEWSPGSIADTVERLPYSLGARDWLGRPKKAVLRMGYLPENPGVAFKGNILYLEGLSDSMLNHDPTFAALSKEGYRIIAFDYPGQGGSTGRMNWTRLTSPRHPHAEIASMAELAWNRYRRREPGVGDRKVVMGWSTGGLAAYQMANRGMADAFIAIAPAVNGVKLLSLRSLRASFQLKVEDLTHADYTREPNPHQEPLVPSAPAKVPAFVLNLIKTAWQSGYWRIPKNIPGLVLLSGDSDPLVNGRRTRRALARNAPHVRVVQFEDAAHEVHNEIRRIREAVLREILDFLARLP